jgi:histidinol dehydrogenase
MRTINLRRLDARAADFDSQLSRLLSSAGDNPALTKQAGEIIQNVRSRGDAALLEYTARFDNYAPECAADLEAPAAELAAALDNIAPDMRAAMETAATRIADYCRRQTPSSWEFEDANGNLLGERVSPLARVGVYAPGGLAAYPSSMLMCAIPARIAGVGEIIAASPASGGKEVSPLTLAAAALSGVHRFFKIGGAQAIAALAFGTATIPKADKIAGPGGAFVSEAKRQLFGKKVGIDAIAGPSEVVILCDAHTNPALAAADFLAQAEHSADALAILLATDAAFLDAACKAINAALPNAPRREIIGASLAARGALIKAPDLSAACEIADTIAPEHLQVMTQNAAEISAQIKNAGAIFIGENSCVALGDYCAGGNHVLPTGGGARFSSPLGVGDFVKRTSFLQASPKGAATLAKTARTLATGEGLHAHAESARLREEK